MANRVIIGKNTNSNHGHSTGSPGYGLYISRSGKDVTTCTADELLFNTDNGTTGALSRIQGIFLCAPVNTNNDTSVTTTVSAGSTATIRLSTVNYDFSFGFIGFGTTSLATGSGGSGGGSEYNFSSDTVNTTISLVNDGTSSISVKTFVIPTFSNLALF